MCSWLQVFQLQQEKKKLQEDFSQLLKEREQLEERCTSFEREKIQMGPRLEESKWEVSGSAGEAPTDGLIQCINGHNKKGLGCKVYHRGSFY